MRQRKLEFLLVTLLVASGLLFVGGEAFAAFTYDLINTTITSSGTSATYTYTVRPTSVDIAGYVDFEIPVEIDITRSGSYTLTVANSSGGTVPLSLSVYDIGIGDFGTKFGVGDLRYRVLKASWSAFTGDIKMTLTLNKTWASERVFADQAQSQNGVFLIKKGNGTNTISFQAPIPTVVDPPVTPVLPSFTSAFTATPSTVEYNGNVTLTWGVANAASVLITSSDGTVQNVTGVTSLSITNLIKTTTYTIVAEGSGTATQTVTVTVNPPAPTATLETNLPPPPSLVSGECASLNWSSQYATSVVISSQVISPSPGPIKQIATGASGIIPICPDNTTTYTLLATGNGTVSLQTTVTVDPPVLQTSCTQIVKIPKDKTQPESCVSVCYELGGEKKMVSADLFDNRFCDDTCPPGVPPADCPSKRQPLAIFDPNSGDPALRVRSVQCSPCGITAGSGAKSIDCVENQNQSSFPFTITGLSKGDGTTDTYSVRCDQMLTAVESTGFTIDLSKDPCRYDGSTNFCWACPVGWSDTGTRCVCNPPKRIVGSSCVY